MWTLVGGLWIQVSPTLQNVEHPYEIFYESKWQKGEKLNAVFAFDFKENILLHFFA